MGEKTRCTRAFLFASAALLLMCAPAFAAETFCEEAQMGTVVSGSGSCTGTYERCWHIDAKEGCDCPDGCQKFVECLGIGCGEGCSGLNCHAQYSCINNNQADCGVFENNEEGCRAREWAEARPYDNCVWTPFVPCGLNENDACLPSAPAPACCKSQLPALSCIEVGGGSHECRRCVPEGSGTLCTGNSDCCQTPNALICKSYGLCERCSGNGATCQMDGDCCGGLVCNGGSCVPSCKNSGETCEGSTGASDCCLPPLAPQALYCDSLNSPPEPDRTCKTCVGIGKKCDSSLGCCSSPNPQLFCDGASQTCMRPPPPPMNVCGTGSFDNVFMVAAIATLATIALIALAYMAGELFQNARALTWAKTEVLQAFVSILIVGAVIGTVQLFCSLQIGEIARIATPYPGIYGTYDSASIYQGAQIYLENLLAASHNNMKGMRHAIGAYEIRTSYTEMKCDGNCWINLVGYNEALYGGETLQLAVTNNLLSTATVSYLSAAFEFFTLQYVLNGLFLVFLPISIVIRSIPFMRQFGGALVAIFLSLYIFYPLMLVFNAGIAQGMVKPGDVVTIYDSGIGCPGSGLFGNGNVVCRQTTQNGEFRREQEISGSVDFPIAANLPDAPDMVLQIRTNALIFLATVFLAAFNFIVIAAVARGVSHFLGDEVDISRLGQMI